MCKTGYAVDTALLSIPRFAFYRWDGCYRFGGEDALQDKAPMPARAWNRIPDSIRARLITLALDLPELSPRELAVTFTDSQGYFVLENSVYRLEAVYWHDNPRCHRDPGARSSGIGL